jgi:hypothetical protein
MVVEIIVIVAACINLVSITLYLTQKRRITISVPPIQPMAEDYLSDILDSLRAIETTVSEIQARVEK